MKLLSDSEVAIVKTVADRFLNLRESTPRKGLLLKLRSLETLDRLVRWTILKSHDQKNYLPLVMAFYYCGDAQISSFAKQSVTVVCHVLRNLFENDQSEDTQFTPAEIETHAKKMYDAVVPEQIRLGLYLGQELRFFSQWGYNPQQTEITTHKISEHIVEINPDDVWDDSIKRQIQWIETQSAGMSLPSTEALEINQEGADIAGPTLDSSVEAVEKYSGWEIINPLGNNTGQGDVFLVRSPQRVAGLADSAKAIQRYTGAITLDQAPPFAAAIWQSARADSVSELGALKVFKMRGDGAKAEQEVLDRLKGEILVLKQNRAGLLRLLASSEEDKWIITEYQPNGTLEDHPVMFQGKAALALKAFRPLVQAVASLHSEEIVHRDIKPANVFVGNETGLILGDFGIVYLPGQPERVTRTHERVGPYDYMPLWADLGERLEKVEANFDVYMLGKLLWCMVAGKLKLPREYHRNPGFDLTQEFPDDPHMHIINRILDKCVVEQARHCLPNASELLLVVDAFLRLIDRDGQLLDEKIPRPCRVCGLGHYQLKLLVQNTVVVGLRFWLVGGSDITTLPVRVFVCDNCKHIEFFSQN
jgi:serine/threonine protein kinase